MKDQFLLDDTLIFLNHGSFGACPREVFAVYQDWQRLLEANPVEFLGRRSGALLHEARTVLADYLGADAYDLVFVPNATSGFNIVARSLRLGPGDEILTTDHEYGACDATWEFVCATSGAALRRVVVPLPFRADEFVERIWSAVTPATRIVSLSHITSTTAVVFPVAELCQRARAAGILTLIDGAHAPGQIPLDLEALGADFYVGNCHKWMCAPKGAGFMHVRRPHHDRLRAPVISWGYNATLAAQPEIAAFTGRSLLEQRMQWQGTRDPAAYLSVPAAIRFQAKHQWPTVQARCHELACAALEQISVRTGLAPLCAPTDFAQMVAIPLPPIDPSALKLRLFEEFGIEVPITVHSGHQFVRVSVQAYNSAHDVGALAVALAACYDTRTAGAGSRVRP